MRGGGCPFGDAALVVGFARSLVGGLGDGASKNRGGDQTQGIGTTGHRIGVPNSLCMKMQCSIISSLNDPGPNCELTNFSQSLRTP